MNNENFVFNSVEKHTSHELINSKFFPWIELNFSRPSYIITMPSRSGRHENLILKYIMGIERETNSESKIRLLTFDNKYTAEYTNIMLYNHHRLWRHEKCGDIFKNLLTYRCREDLIAAWFDLTGGLLNQRLLDIKACVNDLFEHGSLFFITLAIDNARGLTTAHYARQIYDQTTTIEEKAEATSEMLSGIVASENKKYLVPCIDPYVYKHGRATYGVFGFIVAKHDN